MLIIDHGAAAEHVREEDLAQINFEKPLTLGFDHREICLAVLVIYQTVVEHSVHLRENIVKIFLALDILYFYLVAPQSDQLVGVSQVSVRD